MNSSHQRVGCYLASKNGCIVETILRETSQVKSILTFAATWSTLASCTKIFWQGIPMKVQLLTFTYYYYCVLVVTGEAARAH
jgi:hypothetical protein